MKHLFSRFKSKRSSTHSVQLQWYWYRAGTKVSAHTTPHYRQPEDGECMLTFGRHGVQPTMLQYVAKLDRFVCLRTGTILTGGCTYLLFAPIWAAALSSALLPQPGRSSGEAVDSQKEV